MKIEALRERRRNFESKLLMSRERIENGRGRLAQLAAQRKDLERQLGEKRSALTHKQAGCRKLDDQVIEKEARTQELSRTLTERTESLTKLKQEVRT